LSLESARARVFNDEIRSLAAEVRTAAGDAVWAVSLDIAKRASKRLEPLQVKFQEAVALELRSLY
jgi:hypothetical protein